MGKLLQWMRKGIMVWAHEIVGEVERRGCWRPSEEMKISRTTDIPAFLADKCEPVTKSCSMGHEQK